MSWPNITLYWTQYERYDDKTLCSDYALTKDTPYLTLMGKLWGIFLNSGERGHCEMSRSHCNIFCEVLVWCNLQNVLGHCDTHIDGLVQERCNSSVLAMELLLSCINPFIWYLCNGNQVYCVVKCMCVWWIKAWGPVSEMFFELA